MTDFKPNHAFILAAGKGTRLRPYTDNTPKPMVLVDGRPILEHTLDKLQNEDVQHVTINLYYLGDRITKYFEGRTSPKITYSVETELLETGGGVKLAIHTMENNPFYLINGDALWDDAKDTPTALQQLAQAWDADKMDMILLLYPKSKMRDGTGVGDYNINKQGQITRTADGSGEYMFTGIRTTSPALLNDTPQGAFSFLECMDKAQQAGRLYGVNYNGVWHHISTPEDLDNINGLYASQSKKAS